MSLQNSEMEGIKNLRSGSLFLIISALLASIGVIIAITGGLLGFLFSLGTLSAVGAVSSIFGTIIGIVVLVLLSAIIGLNRYT